MVTELVTFKIEKKFLKDIDEVVKEANFQNRTEFIRASLRAGIDQIKLKKTMAELDTLRGSLRKGSQTTDKELEAIREKVFEEMDK